MTRGDFVLLVLLIFVSFIGGVLVTDSLTHRLTQRVCEIERLHGLAAPADTPPILACDSRAK